jgi:hypothetical protein
MMAYSDHVFHLHEMAVEDMPFSAIPKHICEIQVERTTPREFEKQTIVIVEHTQGLELQSLGYSVALDPGVRMPQLLKASRVFG